MLKGHSRHASKIWWSSGYVVLKICEQKGRRTERHTDSPQYTSVLDARTDGRTTRKHNNFDGPYRMGGGGLKRQIDDVGLRRRGQRQLAIICATTHDQSASLWCVCGWLQKPNNDECALFKADDAVALTNGSTFIEIGKCSVLDWREAPGSQPSLYYVTLWVYSFLLHRVIREVL